MRNRTLTAHLSFVDSRLCDAVGALLRSLEFNVVVTDPSKPVGQIDWPNSIVVIETGNDAALLTRRVYELYMEHDQNVMLPIIGIVSVEAVSRNHSLVWWTINDHAAALAVLTNHPSLMDDLYSYFLRIALNIA